MLFFLENTSSLIGRASYVGFYIDWIVEVLGFVADVTIITTTGTIYVGIFLYINGMVEDLKMRVFPIDADFIGDIIPVDIWSIYVHEINLHAEIIKLFTIFALFHTADLICDDFNQFYLFPAHRTQSGNVFKRSDESDFIQFDINLCDCHCIEFACV